MFFDWVEDELSSNWNEYQTCWWWEEEVGGGEVGGGEARGAGGGVEKRGDISRFVTYTAYYVDLEPV
jgi:hypothetical protein